MKALFINVLLFVSAQYVAQKISDYRYVSLSQLKDFSNDKFGLNTLLSSKLQAKGYTVLGSDMASWPAEAASNPCNVLQANLENSSSLLKNKLKVNFQNCKGNSVGSFEGRSNIKDYEEGYRDALTVALNSLLPWNPANQNLATATTIPQTGSKAISPNVTQEEVETRSSAKIENKAEMFTNGIVTLNQIIISNDQFILSNATSATPYAIFSATAKTDVYRVQLQDGIQTFGYAEDGKLVIETTNNAGIPVREIFWRK